MARMTQEQVKLERARGVTLQTIDDGKHTAVMFKVPVGIDGSGVNGAVLGPQDFSRLIELLLEGARRVGASVPADVKGGTLTAVPIPVTSMGIAKGRTAEEGFVLLRLGQMTLTFAVEMTLLHKWCKSVLANTTIIGPPQRH